MKKIIKELFKGWETRRDVLLYEAEFISMTSKEKQETLIKKMREIAREQERILNKTTLLFNLI